MKRREEGKTDVGSFSFPQYNTEQFFPPTSFPFLVSLDRLLLLLIFL